MRVSLLLLLLHTACALTVSAIARLLNRPLDRLTLLLVFLLPVVFLFPGFFANETPVPVDQMIGFYLPWKALPHPPIHNPALSDVASQFVPWAEAVRMAFREGSLPFRNRWSGCGTPLAANGQTAPFSPLTFLMFALPLPQAFVLLGALKLLLASSGMWLWLSELGVSRQAARFGAVIFAFSFTMTPLLYHPASSVISLWPWALFAIETLKTPSLERRGFTLLVLVFTLWPLAGHIESAALGALFGGIWLAGRVLAGDLRESKRVFAKTSLAASAALGLSAFSLLPQALAIRASNRIVLAEDPAQLQWVKPYEPGWLGGFLTALFPRTFGDMIDSPMIAGAGGSMTEMGFAYFGIVGWACALLILRPGGIRPRKEWVLLGLILFGFGGAMGLPPLKALIDVLPGIRLIPPLRIFMFASIAGAALASLEVDRLLRDVEKNRRAALFPLLAAAALAAFALLTFRTYRPLHAAAGGLASQREALLWALTALALFALAMAALSLRKGNAAKKAVLLAVTFISAAELMHQGARLYRFGSPANVYPPTPLIRFLQSRPRPFRVLGEEEALFPNSNVFAGVEEIRTHDPAERRDYVEFLDRTCGYPPSDYFKRVRDFNAPALDFLNVTYFVSGPGREPPGPKWNRIYSSWDGTVFENRLVLPRAFAPPEIEVAPNPRGSSLVKNANDLFGEALRRFLAAGNFAGKALLLRDGRVFDPPRDGRNGRVTVSEFRESVNRASFQVSAESGPAVLVSSFVQDGGWSARDGEGKRLPVGLANGPFLAILLPPGQGTVHLSYLPPGFRIGIFISITTLGALLVGRLGAKRRRKPMRG